MNMVNATCMYRDLSLLIRLPDLSKILENSALIAMVQACYGSGSQNSAQSLGKGAGSLRLEQRHSPVHGVKPD